jgi:hypothetical protein
MSRQSPKFGLTETLPRKGDRRIQDLDCLFRLRNLMLHLKPEPMYNLDSESAPNVKWPPAIAHLIAREVIQEPPGYFGSWRQLVSDSRVARWAFETATDALRWIASAANEENVRHVLEFGTSGFPALPAQASSPPGR